MITVRMRSKGLQAVLVSFLLALGVLSFGGSAFSFQYVLSFGDSLTDNGTFTSPDGYFGETDIYGYGRATTPGYNVWVEYLADRKHLNEPLFDMAYGGATTGYTPIYNPVNLLWQVDLYMTNFSSDVTHNTLVAAWAGGNDCVAASLAYVAYKTINHDIFIATAIAAANNVAAVDVLDSGYSALMDLHDAGFRKFLVLTVPDVGATPRFKNVLNFYYPGIAAAATEWCQTFNTQLKTNLNTLRAQWKGSGSTIYMVDAFEVMAEILADPTEYSKKYGIYSEADVFYTDGFHPSGKTHILIGDIVYKAVK